MKKFAVFASGGGTNLQELIDAVQSKYIKDGLIEVVFSNKKDAYALERAIKHGIKTLYLDPAEFKTPEEYDTYLAQKMNGFGVCLVCLAGYMKILTKAFIDNFKGKIMNIHPALLPSFGGKGYYGLKVHHAVIEHGSKVTGATVHFVDYEADTGPIILQKSVEVADDDTPETLQKKVLVLEHELYKEAVKLFLQDRLVLKGRRVSIKPAGPMD